MYKKLHNPFCLNTLLYQTEYLGITCVDFKAPFLAGMINIYFLVDLKLKHAPFQHKHSENVTINSYLTC